MPRPHAASFARSVLAPNGASGPPCSPTLPRSCAAVLLLILTLFAAACRSTPPSPINLADPAWSTSRAQAVWRPAHHDVELAGDLLIATRPDGHAYLQFSKSPAVLTEIHLNPGHWRAAFPAQNRAFQGPGSPPSRIAFAQLLRIAQNLPPAPAWSFSGSLSARWRLAHRNSGEWIEGNGTP